MGERGRELEDMCREAGDVESVMERQKTSQRLREGMRRCFQRKNKKQLRETGEATNEMTMCQTKEDKGVC